MNVERVYQGHVSPTEVANDLADHFREQDFETQVFNTTTGRTVFQARKDSLWRELLGVAYAVTVTIASENDRLTVSLGGHEWVDTAVRAASAWWLSHRAVGHGLLYLEGAPAR